MYDEPEVSDESKFGTFSFVRKKVSLNDCSKVCVIDLIMCLRDLNEVRIPFQETRLYARRIRT